ncbi:hypothetical protein HDU98_008564 [Podochytrium sp. JEL0797]|nr:hypothetical protein HDU98_008564 [Podochytrium sp. JEL0797]
MSFFSLALSGDTPSALLTSLAPNSILRQALAASDADCGAVGAPADALEVLASPSQTLLACVVASARLRLAAKGDTAPRLDANVLFAHARRIASQLASQKHSEDLDTITVPFAQAMAALADRLRAPMLPVLALRDILRNERYCSPQTNHHQLSRIHVLFLKHCILSKIHQLALPVIELPLSKISRPAKHMLSITDFLLYSYYAGIIFATLKRFDEAVDMFRSCLAAPSRGGTSAIQVEAWRKGVLCHFLAGLPGGWKAFEKDGIAACANLSVLKTIENGGFRKGYLDLLNACNKGVFVVAQAELQKYSDIFAKSNNLGLAKQCCAHHLTRQRILHLTHTHLTLSIADIAKAVRDSVPPPAVDAAVQQPNGGGTGAAQSAALIKHHILHLIESGQVHATMDESIQSDTAVGGTNGAMVSFHDVTHSYADRASMIQLDTLMKTSIRVFDRFSEMDKSLGSSKEYLVKAHVEKERAGGSVGGASVGAGGAGASLGLFNIGTGSGVSFDDDGVEDDDDVFMGDGNDDELV